MNKTLIKICGIRHPDSVPQGADFIGLIFHPASRRYVDLITARAIVKAIKKTTAIPVAVFVNESAQEMERICQTVQIETVQLHGPIAKADHHYLPEHYRRIYLMQQETAPVHCYPERDFLIFDHPCAGQGYTLDWDALRYDGPFRWFLAGGLNVQNVKTAIQCVNPTGVDVSTGVEMTTGEKNKTLMQQFIAQVRG